MNIFPRILFISANSKFFLLFVGDNAFDTMQFFGSTASWFECQRCFQTIRFVYNFHGAILLDPHFSDDNVMNTTIDV